MHGADGGRKTTRDDARPMDAAELLRSPRGGLSVVPRQQVESLLDVGKARRIELSQIVFVPTPRDALLNPVVTGVLISVQKRIIERRSGCGILGNKE